MQQSNLQKQQTTREHGTEKLSSDSCVLRNGVRFKKSCVHVFSWIWVITLVFIGTPTVVFGQPTKAPSTEVSASLFGGDTLRGYILSADSNKATIQSSDGPIERSTSDISQITFSNKLSPQIQPVEVTLADGSKAYGDQFTGSNSGWKLLNTTGSEVAIPAKSIRAVRLKTIPNELADAWKAAINETTEGDAVVVMRTGESLDRIGGIIVQVQPSMVSFELDGQQIEIPIEKLGGLVWFQKARERIKPAVEITTINHSVWMAESFRLQPNGLELKTPLGHIVNMPLSEIHGINYSSANIRWLAELEKIEAVAKKAIEFKSTITNLERGLAPRFVINNHAPTVSSAAADQDLYFPSPGQFVFRMPEGFSTFQSLVQRTDQGTERTDITIEVWQDDQRIVEQALAFNQDSTEINVPVQAGKKIRLAVACSSKLMIGTEVQWKQPRLKR